MGLWLHLNSPRHEAFGSSFGCRRNEVHGLDADAIRPFKKPTVHKVLFAPTGEQRHRHHTPPGIESIRSAEQDQVANNKAFVRIDLGALICIWLFPEHEGKGVA